MADGIINLISFRLPIDVPSNEKDLKYHWVKIYDQSYEYDFKQNLKANSKLEVEGYAVNLKNEKMLDNNYNKKNKAIRIQSKFRQFRAKRHYIEIKKQKANEFIFKRIQ